MSFDSFGGARKAPPQIKARKSLGGAPEPPPNLGVQLSRPPWDQHKPPTAQDFYSFTESSLSLPAGAGSQVATTAATGGFFQLANDSVGVLQLVTMTVDAPTTAMSFRFSVLMNGSALPGLSNVGFPPINASTLAVPIQSVWQLSPGATLSVLFTNLNAAGPIVVGAVLSGYQILASDIAAYTGERVGMIETASQTFKRNLAR